jgi:hypothetical protein
VLRAPLPAHGDCLHLGRVIPAYPFLTVFIKTEITLLWLTISAREWHETIVLGHAESGRAAGANQVVKIKLASLR